NIPFTLDAIVATAPDGWTCSAIAYGDFDPDAACDCGCGIQDPGCASTTDLAECDVDGCPEGFAADPEDTTGCVDLPDDGDTCATALPLVEGTIQGTWAGA